jgi:hypothetical protein
MLCLAASGPITWAEAVIKFNKLVVIGREWPKRPIPSLLPLFLIK